MKAILFLTLVLLLACDSAPRQPRLGTAPQPVDTCKAHHHGEDK